MTVILVFLLINLVPMVIGGVAVLWEDIDTELNYTGALGVFTGDISMEYLGQMYQGNAQNGYSYYRISIPIRNVGEEEFNESYDLYLDVQGEDYDDVKNYYTSGSSSDFTYVCRNVIPVGLSGVAQKVVLIKDGVDEVDVRYYYDSDSYYDGKTPALEMTLQVTGR
jgi:hypothetical protein